MDKKIFIVVLCILVLFSLNFTVAQEVDNSTVVGVEEASGELQTDLNQPSLKNSSLIDTHIDIVSNTTFDVVGEYFKVKLSDKNNNSISNAQISFTFLNVTYLRTTDLDGIASLKIGLADGDYNIASKFAGNSKYGSSLNTTTITVSNTRVVDEGLSNTQIQKIIDNAKENNVILFLGKSYSDINLVITKSLTLLTKSGTVLKSSSSNPVISIKGKNASYTIINGFTIQGQGDGIVVGDSDFVRIINNDIASGGNGIVATGTTYLNITKNNINKNSKSGIVIGNTTSTYIFDNNIKSNGATGIEVAKSDKVYIHGNTITYNKKNGISLSKSAGGVNYGQGPKNVYINKNTISNNEVDGIVINYAGDNINIKSNTIHANKGEGIGISHIGSNTIQSNVIYENWANGIKFFDNYVKPANQVISYNAIYFNLHMDVEAKDTYYQENGERLQIGDNWYTDYAGICPKIRSNNIKFVVKQIGDNKFQALFLDSNGNVASLLPDRTLSYTTNNGKSISITISGGAGVFTVDANDGDLIKAIVDNSRRDNTFDSNSQTVQPINGVTPSYNYPTIPYGGNGDGNGNGDGTGGDANKGNGASNQGSSQNTGNSTHSQKTNPSNSANNPVNDVSQSYDTQTTNSAEAASEVSNGNTGNAGSQSQSVVKQINIEEDEFYRVTGITFIVLLIILTIGFYYREDIKEMNSKR